MKLIIIFLTSLIALLPQSTYAKATNFYEDKYIDNVWMNKITPNRKTIYYQKARMFRQRETGNIAYCLEPFTMFNENSSYEDMVSTKLTEEQKNRIKYLVYLGYKNKGKEDEIWYAITQLLIWETVEPNGLYYFTDSLNGNKTSKYQDLINELNNAVNNYQNSIKTELNYTITIGEKIEIPLDNDYNITYKSDDKYTTITNNTITIENLPVGEHKIVVAQKFNNHKENIVFFTSVDSQDLVTIGNLDEETLAINVKVNDTEVKLDKIDFDTNSKTASGMAKLEGTTYKIYNENMFEVAEIIFDTELTATVKSLPIGKYYIKEIIAGTGYTLDTNIYEFELSKEQPKIAITLKNKVIKGKLKIHKVYIDEDLIKDEENITFNIYDSKNNLYKSLTTDKFGNLEIELPYGTYKIVQQNTTDGYEIVEPFIIIINSNTPLTYDLKDYKIKVPNTYAKSKDNVINQIILKIIKIIGQIYDNKIINNTINYKFQNNI